MGGGGCACRKAVQPCRRPWQSRLPPGRSWMHASLAHWHVLSLTHRHACRAQRGSESGVPPHLLRKDFFIDCKLKEASGFGIHREVAGEHLDKAFQLLRSRRTWRAPNLKGEHQISRASIKSQGRASNPKGEHHTGRALARVPMFERAAEGIGVGRTHPCCRLDGQDVCSRARRYKGGRIAAGVEFKS